MVYRIQGDKFLPMIDEQYGHITNPGSGVGSGVGSGFAYGEIKNGILGESDINIDSMFYSEGYVYASGCGDGGGEVIIES